MAFQPFGYRFSVVSTTPPAEVKARLRAGLKGWFEPKSGPRGWIVGPVVCLWQSAFNKQGPMLLGLISADSLGTRVHGRAGSDLNGVIWSAVLFPLLGVLFYEVAAEDAVPMTATVFFAIVLLLSPTIFWFAHKDRRQAEPLVNFVRRSLGEAGSTPKRRVAIHPGPYLPMELTVNGEPFPHNADPDAIREAVHSIHHDEAGFLILAHSDDVYVQVVSRNGGFVLEKREGGEETHLVANRAPDDPFTAEDVLAALLSYLAGEFDIRGVRWERLYR